MDLKELMGRPCSINLFCANISIQDRDVQEGADILMVKPGMPYLDIVRDTKERVSFNWNSQPKKHFLACEFQAPMGTYSGD